MIDTVSQMLRFPFSVLAYCMEMMAQTLRGMQQIAGESFAAITEIIVPLETISTQGVGGEDAANESKENIMPDKDLSNDKVKLVQYSIVSIQRGLERTLKESERIVSDNITGEGFATWMIAEFIQEDPNRVRHEEKKYLRVYYSVLDQWEQESLHYEEKQLAVLKGIEEAIRHCCEHRELAPSASEAS